MKAPLWGARIKCAVCGVPLTFTNDMKRIRCEHFGCKERMIEYKAPTITLERADMEPADG